MRIVSLILTAFAVSISCTAVQSQQRMQEREEEFLTLQPRVGETLPDVTIYNSDGTPFRTADLREHYTVLTFGCMTCPPSMWNIAELEAVERDYEPRGVKFYFIYKALAHPELAGGYVQPFTTEERLMHARQAALQFGTRIPWVVDDIDNRLKHAMGDRPNSQFLIDPKGVVVRKRAWSNPLSVREDLVTLVGPTDHVTTVAELKLKIELPLAGAAPRGVVPRLAREKMMPIAMKPEVDLDGQPFFAKLRAEVDPDLMRSGEGSIYLGFHLDPFHNAHWNNLTEPLSFRIEADESVEFERREVAADKVSVTSDADPREFLLSVKSWPADQPVRLTVTYAACVGDSECHVVEQSYTLRRSRDQDAGGARGDGAGFWKAADFARQMMIGDKDKDGQLSRTEVVGLVSPHFDALDSNNDELLSLEELLQVADWLNTHHQPGTPGSLDPEVQK